MLKLKTSQFKRDLKLCKKRNYDINLLNTIIDTLRIPAALPPKNKDHVLFTLNVGMQLAVKN
ncbi:MAG: type II toxin-antitoxin system YafQ family toxin [Lachnospiraceae bacterium]|nr:type II toxin-antitoxin system YafQ family toxin [Lachnospiraceae bacterium]